jgi:hypothetical protein
MTSMAGLQDPWVGCSGQAKDEPDSQDSDNALNARITSSWSAT